MKRFIRKFSLVMALAIVFTTCFTVFGAQTVEAKLDSSNTIERPLPFIESPDPVVPSTPVEKDVLKINSVSSAPAFTGGTVTIKFNSTKAWTISVPQEENYKVYLPKQSGYGSNAEQTVSLRLPTNYSRDAKTFNVTIKSNGKSVSTVVRQNGAPSTVHAYYDFDEGLSYASNGVTYFKYALAYDSRVEYNCYTIHFKALEPWKLCVYGPGNPVANKTSGGPGEHSVMFKLPKYDLVKGQDMNVFIYNPANGHYVSISLFYALDSAVIDMKPQKIDWDALFPKP